MRNLMGTLGPAGESLRLAEHYRQMSDEELIELAQNSAELTELAQSALHQEISTRRLSISSPEEPRKPQLEPASSESDDEYAEDRRLVELCKVWSHDDALKLQKLLNGADIPFFIGPERATSADRVSSRFSDGVEVRVMAIGLPWARAVMNSYFPADEPAEQEAESEEDVEIHCPKCHSTDVVFGQLDDESEENDGAFPDKFDWTCASCGYAWEDDGVETKD